MIEIIRESNFWKYRSIAVAGPGRGNGASTLAVNLAKYIEEVHGRTVCFTECVGNDENVCLSYDRYGMEKRFERTDFDNIYDQILEDKSVSCNNWDGKINWRLRPSDRSGENRSSEKQLDLSNDSRAWRLLSSARGDYLVFDIDYTGIYRDFLKDMDLILAVIDPLPSKLASQLENIAALQKLSCEGSNIIWIINKMNDGVSRRQVKKLFRGEKLVFFDFLDYCMLYGAEYRCGYLWDIPQIKEKFMELFTKISQ